VTTDPGQRARDVLAYIYRHPGCTKAEARQGADASYESVEAAVRLGHARERPQRGERRAAGPRLYLTDTGLRALATPQPADPGRPAARAPAAAPGARPRPAPGLTRALAALAAELLRDCGRLTIGGRTYQVIIPDGGHPPATVCLRRDDGRLFTAHPHVRVRDTGPAEPGIDR
jgi:hypothetical protein